MAPAVQGVPHARAWVCLYTAAGVSSVKKGEGRDRRGLGRAVEVWPDTTGLARLRDAAGFSAWLRLEAKSVFLTKSQLLNNSPSAREISRTGPLTSPDNVQDRRGRRGLGRAVEVRPDATGLGVCLDDAGGDADGAVCQATIGPCGRALTRMLRHDT